MTMNSPLPRVFLSPAAPAPLHLLTRQSVTPLSRTAFVRLLVKEWLLLREPIAGPLSYPGWPTRLKPPSASSKLPLTSP